MAKINGPALSMVASGRVGDLVYGRNQYGPWVRPYKVPQPPISELQILHQNRFKAAVETWLSMEPWEREGWENAAKNFKFPDSIGQPRIITGRSLFIRNSLAAQQINVGVHTFPVSSSFFYGCDYFPILTISQDSSGLLLSADPAPFDDAGIICKGSYPVSLTRKTLPSLLYPLPFMNSTTELPLLLIPNANLPVETKRIFFRFQPVGSGNWPGPYLVRYFDCSQL